LKTITFSYITYNAHAKVWLRLLNIDTLILNEFQAKLVHRLCSKLYNITEKNEILHIDTEVVKLSCGFFNFDWDVSIIVNFSNNLKILLN
jgi:hypothetical protein